MKNIIKLIKADVPSDKIVKIDKKIHSEQIDGVGTFYYKISKAQTPDWLSRFFLDKLQCAEKLKVASAAGLLLVSREYADGMRVFAITFGSGRYLLEDDVIEERFGLRIALNSIKYDTLRSIDYSKMDGIPSVVRNQVSRLTSIENFSIDTQVNLMKSITGALPEDKQKEIGTSMTGTDSLALNSAVAVNGILAKLDQLYNLYKSETYKQHFAWVDNIKSIGTPTLVGQLDNELFSLINNRQLGNVWMAIPTIIDWTSISHFKFSGRNPNEYDDVSLADVLRDKFEDRKDIKPIEFKTAKIKSVDTDGKEKEYAIYKCLYAEIRLEEDMYILNEGLWYKIENSFYSEIENTYRNVLPADIHFIPWEPKLKEGREKFEEEKDYNNRLAKSDASFCNMDRKTIHPVSGHSKIEFCDVFSRQGHIIHVKRKGGSELIGHLLNQGRVSGELMLTEDFRKKINEKLRENNHPGWSVPENNAEFRTGEYSIVFAVLSTEDTDVPSLPFFSKVILRDTVNTLRGFGYNVYLNNIKKEP